MSYSRDDESGETLGCLVFAAIIVIPTSIWALIGDGEKQIKRDAQTKPVLMKAHEQAVASVDTINYNDVIIDTKNARKDSARTTKQMYKIMDIIYENRTKRFFDYVQDSIPIKSNYSRTISTYVDSVSHDTVRVVWSRHKTISGAYPQFNLNKALKDSAFAATYSQYCEAIKQLEIARRQQNVK